MNETSELLMKLADALDAASALARKIAERQPTRVELKLDGQTFAQAVIGRDRGGGAAVVSALRRDGKTDAGGCID